MGLTPEEVDSRTLFHKGNETTIPMHKRVREMYNDMMYELNALLPDGRAKSVALTQLEDSEMWANKAVAELAPLVED